MQKATLYLENTHQALLDMKQIAYPVYIKQRKLNF